jgi:hypothetical protein
VAPRTIQYRNPRYPACFLRDLDEAADLGNTDIVVENVDAVVSRDTGSIIAATSAVARKRDRRCLAIAPAGANRPGADNKCYLAFEPISNVSAPIGPQQNNLL